MDNIDLLIAGHLVLDKIELAGAPRTCRLGGPPFYSAVAASRLRAKVKVLSRIGEDFPQEYINLLKNEGIDVSLVKKCEKTETTSFHIKYLDETMNKRKMRLQALCSEIPASDVPFDLKVKAVHIAPVANEIPLETFRKLREIAEIACLDPQGYIREFDKAGNVKLISWRNESFLRNIEVFKSNIEEIQSITGLLDTRESMRKIAEYGVETIIVTAGEKGALLLFDGEFRKVPAYPVSKVVDSTGAGDVFIGAYLAEHVKSEAPIWCACVGAAAASILVERRGLARFGDKKEVYERAGILYERYVKF